MALNARQQKFVAEYLVDFNGQRSAIAAGYSPVGAKVTASRLLTQPNVKALVQKKQAALAARLEVRREDLVRGILEAIEMAREQGDAGAMIRGAAELARLLGLYAPEKRSRQTLSGAETEDLQRLSDPELLELIVGEGREHPENEA